MCNDPYEAYEAYLRQFTKTLNVILDPNKTIETKPVPEKAVGVREFEEVRHD